MWFSVVTMTYKSNTRSMPRLKRRCTKHPLLHHFKGVIIHPTYQASSLPTPTLASISTKMQFFTLIFFLLTALPSFANPAGNCNPRNDPRCFFNPPTRQWQASFTFDRNTVDLSRNPYQINLRHLHIAVVTTSSGGVDFVITANNMPLKVDNVLYRATVEGIRRTGTWFPHDPNDPIHRVSYTALEIASLPSTSSHTIHFTFEFSEESEL